MLVRLNSIKLYKSKKIWISLVILVILAVVISYFVKSLSRPALGVIAPETGLSPANDYSAPGTVKYAGSYLSFVYPSRYRIADDSTSGKILETVSLYAKDHSQISITLAVLVDNFAQDSGITYRRENPGLYKPVSSPAGSIGIESNNSSGYERDQFVAHNNLVASIVLLSPSPSIVKNDFNTVASSLVWH